MRRTTPLVSLLLVSLLPAVAWAAPSQFEALREQGWLLAYLGVFAAGFGTSLTPCVYPMIPIVVGIFGAKESTSRLRAFGLASMYVLGMGVMYSLLGVGAALTGYAFGSLLANPWVVVPLVGFYALMAASMFGAFEISLPASWQARLSGVGGKGTWGAFAMGLVGGLTAAPCTGPLLAGLLAFIASTRNVPLGFSLMFVYALGMGILFWLIATFAVALPKSGRWMESVKSVGGIALLVVGFYFLRPVWPVLTRLTDPSFAFLAGALAVGVAGLAAGAAHLSFHDGLGVKLRKGIGIFMVVAGSSATVNWVLTPRHPLPWRHDEDAALVEARSKGAPLLLDFGAEWCAPCKELETTLFADPLVHADVETRFIPVKVDLTADNSASRSSKERWKLAEEPPLPTLILATSDGKELRRFEGVPKRSEFLDAIRAVR